MNKLNFIDELIKATNCPKNTDVYSYIASIIFNKTIEECREFDYEYKPYNDGKKRRDKVKMALINLLLYRKEEVTLYTDNNEPSITLQLLKCFPKILELTNIKEWE